MIVIRRTLCSAIAIVLVAALFQGCASSPDKPLATKDLQSVNQIRLIKHQFPGYMKETTGSKVASTAAAAPFMLFGAVGGAIGGGLYASIKSSMMKSAGQEMQMKYNLPDFLELVHKDLGEELPKNLPGWPSITIETNAVSDDYTDPSSCLLTVRSTVVISDGAGLQADTMAQLVDKTQNVLWKKRATYKSSDLNRPCKTDELEAGNGKLLHEEISFAVEKTVTELINDLKNGADKKELASTETKKTE